MQPGGGGGNTPLDLGGGRTPEWGPDAPWRKPYNPNAAPIYDVNGVEIPRQANTGGNESTGQQGMPKYDPRGMPGSTMLGQPGGGIGMMTPNNPNDGMSLGSDWANPTPMPKPVMTEAPTPMPKPMMTDAGGGVGMSMSNNPNETGMTMGAFKRGGKVTAVKKYAKGGAVKSTPVKASSRGDGIAQRGKTKGKIY
tara:strand:+ start:394 stop:978 length:585 start_codon:yes stop_codon:yes gene_type:complete